ncbi:SDR family NAD(P)-dependent oxidoreductase [Tropicibacter sp. R15_0]|uniref:SDR family NAD(P)-dependent oxidoreductase n=1 Tax=Tropicibacter sp. R15_0 TaxID=2821101 RepID=UPI001ADBCCB8|nr:SDR family NAD(P)-dependent oxidoreductase [Tropicibacter sp. R15_0]MBO9465450.1 SDR family NAD(P)-dependent oxidoreductase [Tropicibacter sp. R15_0]
MRIEGSVAIVTGGASGLGEATARHLAAQGARVGVLDFNIEQATRVAQDIDGVAAQVDVSDETAVDAAIAQVETALGVPRIAVNCAGIGTAARIVGREGKTSFDTFRRTLEVNLFGSYAVMTHAARRMMELDPEEGERGAIVNTASVAFQDGQLGQAAYAASKGGIAAMSLPAAREFARAGIRVMTIAPGLFNTPMMESLPDEVTAQIVSNIPHPARLGAPEEYALMAAQIISNPYLNGTTIRLDGATRLPPR